MGVIGRRNAVGDLFVSGAVAFPECDFATAVDSIKQKEIELILGPEAKELLRKMEQVEGVAPLRKMDQGKGGALQTDKIKEVWELEDWGHDEWAEQVLAEMAFALAMNVHYVPERNNRHGNVAGYKVRRAPNGLVLVPSDGDEDIFVAVRAERTKQRAFLLGWLRGSEGKLPQFYQKNCWVIPPEALHDLQMLPGKERLKAMRPSSICPDTSSDADTSGIHGQLRIERTR